MPAFTPPDCSKAPGQPKPIKIPGPVISEISPPSLQGPLASMLCGDNTHLPITDSERALFAACFGKVVDQILAETD